MDSTTRLTLPGSEAPITLTLGADVADVVSQLHGHRVEQSQDAEVGRTYLELPDFGVELMFSQEALAAVFLHLTDQGIGVFSGSTQLLSAEVMTSRNPEVFAATLINQGFQRSARQYGFATDLLNAALRIRLEIRDDRALILIDDGARLRETSTTSRAGGA